MVLTFHVYKLIGLCKLNTGTHEIFYINYIDTMFTKHVNIFTIQGNTMVISGSDILSMAP
jgi:hypothetical protein